MIPREEWLHLARKLDWTFGHAAEREVFPEDPSGKPWLPHRDWEDWDEPYRVTFGDYVRTQHEKESSVSAVQDAVGRPEDVRSLDRAWRNGVKLHAATLPLAEFAAVIGNLRAARFGRDSAWRTMALFGALDECRHTQIPLRLLHDFVRDDPQWDWTHRFYHTNCWVAIAGRHMTDEMLLGSDAIEFAVATNFVFETGFTNLQFLGLASLSDRSGDHLFEKMAASIQTDEARHAQIGPSVLAKIAAADPEYAQRLLDKWFWRSWLFFAITTGVVMDYLSPLAGRARSFKEFVEEWVLDQYLASVAALGLRRPRYWDAFVESLDHYHHMIYASAYTYRATVWFDFVLPGPEERAWLRRKYPASWDRFDPVWDRISACWRACDPGVEFGVHGTAIPGFCDLCQLVLANGTPARNGAVTLARDGRRWIFCSEPCRWIFEQEPERYAGHKSLVGRVLGGEAPANLMEMLTRYCGLRHETWGKDAFGGDYPWLRRNGKAAAPATPPPPAALPRGDTPLVPLHGFLEGDTLGILVLAHEDMTLGEVAGRLASAASVRVAPVPAAELRIEHEGRILDPALTVAGAGLAALDRIDVRRRIA